MEGAAGAPLRLVRGGEGLRFRREDDEDDIRAGYDPERAHAGMRAAAGAWTALDAEELKVCISRGREEGTGPLDDES